MLLLLAHRAQVPHIRCAPRGNVTHMAKQVRMPQTPLAASSDLESLGGGGRELRAGGLLLLLLMSQHGALGLQEGCLQ